MASMILRASCVSAAAGKANMVPCRSMASTTAFVPWAADGRAASGRVPEQVVDHSGLPDRTCTPVRDR